MINRGLFSAVAFLFVILFAASASSRADDLDDAMQGYLDAVHYANTVAFLHCFSHNDKWRFVSYRAGTSAIVGTTAFSYDETEEAINKRGGFYSAFFVGTPQYRYRDRIAAHPFSSWHRVDDNVFRLAESEGISFVRWRKDDNQWVIASIGDDAP
jgi:hypothetical protein